MNSYLCAFTEHYSGKPVGQAESVLDIAKEVIACIIVVTLFFIDLARWAFWYSMEEAE